ncbi:MAG: hypothetical protein NTV06_04235 [candidate division Zixibacteria bacterium]|nr:hypothetical protein [candidate division Zixibacteria bacterium]
MALDESTDEMEKLESNGITAYIDHSLNEHLAQMGDIKMDYISDESGSSGYRITIGDPKCGSGDCHCD